MGVREPRQTAKNLDWRLQHRHRHHALRRQIGARIIRPNQRAVQAGLVRPASAR